MQSGTASVLADSTALTATTAELNLLDGKSIVTTISSPTDVQIPTAQAVDERIVDLVTDVGGFRPIANETSFPTTNPDPENNAGTIVSVKALASNLTSNGSGVATIANGAGSGNTVTINGMANSDTIEAGKGILVETTSTLHTYTFHRETLAPADITSAKTAVDDFNERYRVHAGEPSSSLNEGDLVYDTNADKMKVYDSSTSAWKEVTSTGDFKYLFLCPAGGSGAPTINGNIATYDLREGSNSGSAASVTNAAQLVVSVNGVVQKANTGTSAPAEGFALVDANTIIFSSNLPNGASVFIHQAGSAVSIPTPGDNTVSTAKIQNLAVTDAKIANDTISEGKLDIHQAPSDGKFLKYTSSNGMEWGDVPAGVGGATGVDFNDDVEARWGTGNDLIIKHTSNESYIHSKTGDLNINVWDSTAGAWDEAIVVKADSAGVDIKHNAATKLATSATGVTVTGTVAATAYTGDGSSLTGVSSTVLDGCGYQNDQTISAGTYSIAANKGVQDDAIDSAEIADGAVDLAHLSASGTASSSTFLRGDNSWAAAGGVTSDANHNTFGGTSAMNSLTSGVKSTAFGKEALYSFTDDGNNSAFGYQALKDTTGGANTGIGYLAGANTSTGVHNTFVGSQAGEATTTGTYNTAIGHQALHDANGSANYNVCVGSWAGEEMTSGDYNVCIGHDAGHKQKTGQYNVWIGNECGYGDGASTLSSYKNTGVGTQVLASIDTAFYNSFFGWNGGKNVTSGNSNTGIGNHAGFDITTGDNNVCLGPNAGKSNSPSGSITTGDNTICLGDNAIANLYCNDTSISSSDERDKTDFTDWTHGLDWINKLKPISYRWDKRAWYHEYDEETGSIKKEGTPDGSKKRARLHLGFKAQDVLAVEQADGYASKKDDMLLVNLNEDDSAYGMKYERLVVVLTKAVQELSAEVNTLKTKVAALEAG